MADWPPLKNAVFTACFPIYDNDGDLVADAAGLDSEVSTDGGTFADTNTEAVQIATSSGIYKLECNAAEMNGDVICTVTKSSSTNSKDAVNVMYTVARQLKDLAFPVTSGRGIEVESDNMVHADIKEWLGAAPLALSSQRVQSHVGAMAADVVTATAIQNDAITAAKIADSAIDAATFAANALSATAFAQGAADKVWSSATRNLTALGFTIANTDFAAGAIDAAAIAADAIGASEFAQGAADKVWSTAARTLTALGFNLANTDFAAGAINAAAIADGAIDAATFAAGAIDAAAIANGAIDAATFAAGAIDAAALAADAGNEIADAVLSRNVSNVEGSAPATSLCTAILKGTSRVRDNAGTLEIYRTNGTTIHASQTITTDAGNDPIDELTVAS